MNTNHFILSNDAFVSKIHTSICNNCGNNELINFESKANALYLYCDSCKDNKNISMKQSTLDIILYEIKNTLESLSESLLSNLKIEILKNKKDKNVSLFINDIKINKLQFEYSLTEKECYYLKNTILYLINDYTDTSNIEIYINLN